MDLQFIARLVVGASAGSLLVVGVGVLAWEAMRPRREPVERDSGPLGAVNYVGILGFVAAGLASAWSMVGTLAPLDWPFDAAIRAVGIVGLAVSGLLAVWGLRSIGGQMSSRAEVHADTVLVTGGAFGLVRHPLYLSILLLWASASAALLSWAMAAGCLLLAPLFAARSRAEERLLIDHFGDAYRAYSARVPMLVPRPGHGSSPSSRIAGS